MRPALSRRGRLLIKRAELRANGPRYLVDWDRARWERERRKRRPLDRRWDAQFDNAAIEAAFRAALPIYDMQPRAGATVRFRPPLDLQCKVTGGCWVSRAKEFVFPDNDLTRFAEGLEVIEVPGDHDSMVLEPNVRVLAARLKLVVDAIAAPATLAQVAE